MDEPSATIPSQPYPPAPRHLPSQFPVPVSGFHPHSHHPLPSQLDPSLDDAFSSHFTGQLDDSSNGQLLHPGNSFGQRNNQQTFQESDSPRFQEIRSSTGPLSHQSPNHVFHGQPGQFGVLMPLLQPLQSQQDPLDRIHHEDAMVHVPENANDKKEGHFANMKSIPNPPNLESWRERLFHVNETITMSEEEYVKLVVFAKLMLTYAESITDSKLTFLMSITYTPTVRLKSTNENHSSPIIGIVV